jgi:hypothetical protein
MSAFALNPSLDVSRRGFLCLCAVDEELELFELLLGLHLRRL